MNRRILISEEEKKQIRALYETKKKEIDYFQILESKVDRLLNEQHTDPVLYPGEFMTPDGQTIKKITQGVKNPLQLKIETNFPPGEFTPFVLTNEEKQKIQNWYNDDSLTGVETEIIVTAGSSKSGSGNEEQRRQFNINLAQQRANTAFGVIRQFLSTFSDEEILNSVNYITDVSQAFSGPDYIPGVNTSKEKQYQPFQFVTITIQARGNTQVESSRDIKFQPYQIRPYSNVVNSGIVNFCIKGFSVPEYGGYQCDGGNGGYRAVYYSNNIKANDVSKSRWIPIADEDPGYQDLENSNLVRSKGVFSEPDASYCFQYEFNGADPKKCQKFYDKWPNYNYRYRRGGIGSDWSLPGPEINKNIYEPIQKNWKIFLDRLNGRVTTE